MLLWGKPELLTPGLPPAAGIVLRAVAMYRLYASSHSASCSSRRARARARAARRALRFSSVTRRPA